MSGPLSSERSATVSAAFAGPEQESPFFRGDATLVDQIVAWHAARIDQRVLRPGMRLASIRRFADTHRVSRFTVVEAYDRLVAHGYVESRRGSGFFVRGPQARASATPARRRPAETAPVTLDVGWLVRSMLGDLPARDMPGAGTLPADWLDAAMLAGAQREVARGGALLLGYGSPQGWMPLREQLALKLAEADIVAPPEQIVTTCGVTHALELILQHFVRAGDTVLVDEPGWYLPFGRLARMGARAVGVPRQADGPDVAQLRALAARHRPRLFLTSSVLHNPTGTSQSAARAHQVLRAADELDFRVVDDDIYGDLHPGAAVEPAMRLATLDGLRRVIHLGGFSKTLAADLRVGFIACDAALARALTELKMLTGLTTPQWGEQVAHRVLAHGQYRRHLQRLRARLRPAREAALRALEPLGLRAFAMPAAGMFVWVDAGVDTAPLAQAFLKDGLLLAPGSLFLPDQRPSTWLRFNAAVCDNPRMLAALARALERSTATPTPRPTIKP